VGTAFTQGALELAIAEDFKNLSVVNTRHHKVYSTDEVVIPTGLFKFESSCDAKKQLEAVETKTAEAVAQRPTPHPEDDFGPDFVIEDDEAFTSRLKTKRTLYARFTVQNLNY
jgi:hypothetical protein